MHSFRLIPLPFKLYAFLTSTINKFSCETDDLDRHIDTGKEVIYKEQLFWLLKRPAQRNCGLNASSAFHNLWGVWTQKTPHIGNHSGL